MKIIISPAKRMKADTDSLPVRTAPAYPQKTGVLLQYLRGLDLPQLQALLQCNDKIALENYHRFRNMDPAAPRTPAIFAYQGIQYQYMGPTAFTDGEYRYLQERLRILSGFYGMLRPFDGIYPYRLEMQARLRTDFCGNLYDFWGEDLGRDLSRDNDWVLDLASEEYSKAARRGASVRWITVRFGEETGGKFREKGTQCKMARGAMVRWLAEQDVEDPARLPEFARLGYRFSEARSGGDLLVFCKDTEEKRHA